MGLGPADIEQFFEINCIVFCCLQNSLAIVRMNGYLMAVMKAGPDPGPRVRVCLESADPVNRGSGGTLSKIRHLYRALQEEHKIA